MKKFTISAIGLLLFSLTQAQTAFHKYSLSVSLTGGSTRAFYTTSLTHPSDIGNKGHRECIHGAVDPLILEFGVSDRFGIGLTAGGDRYDIDSRKYYNYSPQYGNGKLTTYTGYVTFDCNYHPFVGTKLDVSLYGGIGTFKVNVLDCPEGEATEANANASDGSSNSDVATTKYYQYMARGPIVRTGVKMRYYFWRRLGAMMMVTGFTGKATPTGNGYYSFGNDYSTRITGVSTEFGICYRFF